jgi:malate dehydrogenase (oxaloacetate-decarboxylating)
MGRKGGMNSLKDTLAVITNKSNERGTLSEVVKNADVLIGASTKGAFTKEMIRSMNPRPIVFALANPVAEISHREAKAAGAVVTATGSSLPNQVNNMLAFPGIFRGALDVRASRINMRMLIAAGNAIAASVSGSMLSYDYVVPNFARHGEAVSTTGNVARAVAKAAVESKVARRPAMPKGGKGRKAF